MRKKSDLRIWLGLISLTLMHGANHALMIVLFLAPFFPQMRLDLGIENPGHMQLMSTLNLMVYALSSLPIGLIGDRYPKTRILSITMALNGLAIIGLGFTEKYWLLMLFAIAGGFMGGGFHPISQALVTELMPDKKGVGLGVMGIGSSLGYIIAPLLANGTADIFNKYPWQNASIIIGGIGIIVAFIFTIITLDLSKGINSKSREDHVSDWSGFPWKFVGTMILVFGLRDIIGYGIYPLTSGFYQEGLSIDRSNVAWFLSLYYLPGLIAQPFFGATSDRLQRDKIVMPALCLMAIAMFTTPWLVKISPALPILFLGAAMSSTVPTIDAFVADGVPLKYRGRAFGLLFTFGIGIGSLGPMILGYAAYRLGFREAYLLGGLIPLIAGIIIWILSKTHVKERPKDLF